MLPFFASKKMDEIRAIDIVRWQNALMAPDANDGRPYSTTYLRTLNNQLTAILDHAERYYGLSPNPAMKPVQPNCNIVEKHSAKQCAPDKVNLQERNLTNTAA